MNITLEDFQKVNREYRTEYDVFDSTGSYIETFFADYLDKEGNYQDAAVFCDFDKIREYAAATVKRVRFDPFSNRLSVKIVI